MEYLAIILLVIALLALFVSSRQRRNAGLPAGRIAYSDTGSWGRVEKPLYDPISGLTGKPDYLVEEKGFLIPVEVKSGRAPSLPYDSHIFQLAAYCLLVERTEGVRPPYGILRYRDKTFAIDYTPQLQRELETLLETMRAEEKRLESKRARQAGLEAERSHNEPARCARCGYRNICNQRL